MKGKAISIVLGILVIVPFALSPISAGVTQNSATK